MFIATEEGGKADIALDLLLAFCVRCGEAGLAE